MLWEPDGAIVSWNAASERLYGYGVGEAVGRPILMLVEPERHDFWRAALPDMLAGKLFEQYETVRVHKTGRRIDVSLTVSPIHGDDGRPTAVVTSHATSPSGSARPSASASYSTSSTTG